MSVICFSVSQLTDKTRGLAIHGENMKKRCPREDTREIRLEQGCDSAENKGVDIIEILG